MSALFSGPMSRQQFSDLFFERLPFIDEIMYENFDAPALTYPDIFNVRSSERAFEDTTGVTGFALFSEKDADGGVVEYDTLLQAFEKRFTHGTFAKGFQITEEAQEDDIDGVISNAAPALGRAAQVSIETTIWNAFNNAMPGGSELSPDNVTVFNTAHVLRGGGTFSNLISGDLAVATLESALNVFDNMVDERGVLIQSQAQLLLIPTELQWVAHEILKSQLRYDTANNAANAFTQAGIRIVKTQYLTSLTDWFVGAPPGQTRNIVYWRKEPVTDHTLDFDTGNMKSKMTYRLSVGWADWRLWVAGDGA